jgi:hypothetical protein
METGMADLRYGEAMTRIIAPVVSEKVLEATALALWMAKAREDWEVLNTQEKEKYYDRANDALTAALPPMESVLIGKYHGVDICGNERVEPLTSTEWVERIRSMLAVHGAKQ